MKQSFRNLIHVLSRFKMASALNIIGLGIAFASFSIIMMQVVYEKTYNHCHSNYERIYRLEWSIDGQYAAVIQRPLARVFSQSPHVEAMAFISPSLFTQSFVVKDGDTDRHFQKGLINASADITKVFSFNFLEGDSDALKNPATVIIPKSYADMFFQNVPALGQLIEFEDTTRTVTGVYEDFPKNSTIQNSIYCVSDQYNHFDNWYSANEFAYFLFDSPENAYSIIDEMAHLIKHEVYDCKSAEEFASKAHSLIRFNPMDDIYYSNEVKYIFSETGSRQTTLILIFVAFIIIIIAGINFTNFSTALTPMRIKGINTRKVLGSSVPSLRRSLVGEGIFISLIAFIFSILIIYLCKGSFINGFVASGISILGNLPVILATALISVLTGALAGLYPAFYMTSFSPALVLKGSFGLSMKGRRIRTVLLCIQYIASITLLIASSFLILQNKHMLRTAFGYDKDQIVTVIVNDNILRSEDAFVSALAQNEAIDHTAFSYAFLSCMDDSPNWGRDYKDGHIQFNAFAVTYDMCNTLGVKIKDGRGFLKSDQNIPGGAFVFNETAAKLYGLKPGDDIGGQVVGIMEDIVYSSFRTPLGPMCFSMFGTEGNWIGMPLKVCYIRINKGSNYDAAVKFIEKTLKEYDSVSPFEVKNQDANIEAAYRYERSVSSLISLFGIISIIISIVGIYGLVVFETEYKRKEIGVRKVFGSTTGQIMKMFSTSYMKLIAICTVIAVPLSYYFVHRWLSQFETKTPIYWWVFVLAFIAITLITLLTCSYQNYKAACANPATSIKSE